MRREVVVELVNDWLVRAREIRREARRADAPRAHSCEECGCDFPRELPEIRADELEELARELAGRFRLHPLEIRV